MTRFPVEKHEDESGAWQQRVKLPITVATPAKLPRSQSFANENENLSKVCQNLLPFGAEGSAGLPNLPNMRFSELGSQSNTNSESSKPTVFRIGSNQTHPKFHRARSVSNLQTHMTGH